MTDSTSPFVTGRVVATHLAIIDWDDTVMPSSYLTEHLNFSQMPGPNSVLMFSEKPGHSMEAICRDLAFAGEAALRMLQTLYAMFGRNVLIVTNALEKWLWSSLDVTGSLAPVWREVAALLTTQRTKIYYARANNLDKVTVFRQILGRGFQGMHRDAAPLNVLTIGDQWKDHVLTHQVSHHKIKFSQSPSARFLASELLTVIKLLSDPNGAFFCVQMNPEKQMLIWLKEENLTESPRSQSPVTPGSSEGGGWEQVSNYNRR